MIGLRRLLLLLVALLVAGPLAAADAWSPAKPIRLIVGYAPGSGADQVARLVANKLQEAFKQGVIVDNKPGAGGAIGAQEVARAAADGYTLLLAALPQIAIAPASNQSLPYQPQRDFAPITELVGTDLVLITNPQKVPANSVAEFVTWAAAQPVVFMGDPGPGTVGHFGSFVFANALKLKIESVHYKSTGDSMTGMLSGDINAQFVPHAVALAQVKAGKLRALVTTGPSRSALFPDVPTFKEAGYPDLEFTSWYAIFAPAKTPTEILDRINAEAVKAVQSPDLRAKLEDAGLRVTGTSRDDFARQVKNDTVRWGKIVQASGFKEQN